jgi:hypothetical protein
MRTRIFLGLLIALSGVAHGAEVSGNELGQKCRSEAAAELAQCDLYLEAVLGTTRALGSVFDDYYMVNFDAIARELDTEASRKLFNAMSLKVCIRPNEPISTVRGAFLEYLGGHPDVAKDPAYWAVTYTLVSRWGCRITYK